MAPKAIIIISKSTLALRILALLFLLGSLVILVTNKFTFLDDHKINFKDIGTYRYLFTTAAIGLSISLLQIFLAMYNISWARKMILPEFFRNFDVFADQLTSNLLAAGVGAGFAYNIEIKKFISGILDSLIVIGLPDADKLKSEAAKFLNMGNYATSLLLIGFVCMAVLSLVSSAVDRAKNIRGFGE